MKKQIISALAVASLASGLSAQTFKSGDIIANETWGGAANPSPIILDNAVFVKDGATLTILPGTIVRGQPRTAAVTTGSSVGTPGVLIVTQTGRLNAVGNSTNPIIFTTAAVDNNNDGIPDDDDVDGYLDAYVSGDTFYDDTPTTAPLAPIDLAGKANVQLWGGVVICGNAPTNIAEKNGIGYGLGIVEGLTVPGFPVADATYGGVLPHDNSGDIEYVSIRHAGDVIGANNELNGLTLAGVGDGTVIDHLEIYCNFDDGIEWFGGTVNSRHLFICFAGDDSFDIDEGFTGTNQFGFAIMPFFNENSGAAWGSGSGDKAVEGDGDDYRPDSVDLYGNLNVRLNADQDTADGTPWPLSYPALWNVTVIGSTPDAGQEFTPVSAASTNRGMQFRNGFAGEVYNSFIVNTGAETGIELDANTGKSITGFDAVDNANNGLIAFVSSTTASGAAFGTGENTIVSNGDTLATKLGGTANVINGTNSLANEDTTFNPQGNASGKLDSSLKSSPIDPRPNFAFSGIAGGVKPQGASLDSTATYRGAFDRAAGTLWTTGWTALNIAGLLAD